jgi:hypothetical protein
MTAFGSTTRPSAAYTALLVLVLYGVVRGGEALAADQLPGIDPASKPDPSGAHEPRESTSESASLHSPLLLSLDRHDDLKTFSPTEFRPRVRVQSGSDEPAIAAIIGDKATVEGSVWQHMAEYKSQDRLRLLTLWQTRGSTLSLQAGKHGGPSLQWSSPWMMRDGASSGLFDRWLSAPLRGIATGSRNTAVRPAPEPPKVATSSASSAP